MRRGEIRLVDLDPVRGSEANKTRPAVIVSNNNAVVTVVLLTSNTERVYPFQVLLSASECGIDRDSKVQAEQIRAVAAMRIGRRIGTVPIERMAVLDAALRLHLAL